MDEFTPDDIERGLLAYTADRLDPEAQLPALITAAIRTAEDPERVGSMLRRGASVRVYPDADGSARLVLEFGEEAEVLAAVRAAVWGADAESAPPPGSDERGEVLTLRSLPVSALAALPTG